MRGMPFLYKLIVLAIVCTVLALAVVHSRGTAVDTGYRVDRMRVELLTLKRRNSALRFEVEKLKSPDRLIDSTSDLGIGLYPPAPGRVVDTCEAGGERADSRR